MNKESEGEDLSILDDVFGSIGSDSKTQQTSDESKVGETTTKDESSESTESVAPNKEEVVEVVSADAADLKSNAESTANSIFKDIEVIDQKKPEGEKPDGEKVGDKKEDTEAPTKEEKKEEEKADDKVKAGDDTTDGKKVADDDVHAAALEKDVPGGAHAKESTRKDWEELRTAAKEYKKQYDEHKAKVAELTAEKEALEKRISSGEAQVPQEVMSELEMLRNRVIEFDVSLLPDIREKYDKKIESSYTAVMNWFAEAAKDPNRSYEVLDENGAPTGKISGITPDVVDLLKKSVDSVGFTNYDWSRWINLCLENKVISGIDARRLENTIANAVTLQQNKEIDIRARKQTWVEDTAKKQIASQIAAEENRRSAMAIVDGTRKMLEDTKSKYEWAKPPGELPTNATAEQKQEHAEKVRLYSERGSLFQKILKVYWGSKSINYDGSDKVPDLTPDELGDVLVRAFSVEDLNSKISKVEAKNAELQRELDAYRAGGSTAPRSSARSGDSSPQLQPSAVKSLPSVLTADSILGSIG